VAAVVNAAREAFDAEQTAAAQDATEEEDVVLEAAGGATRLRVELQVELQREAPLTDDDDEDILADFDDGDADKASNDRAEGVACVLRDRPSR
jgi:crotonobetainyl-CoA:carnitine CoA-transferase CaiB-like acyl-CoA transferase